MSGSFFFTALACLLLTVSVSLQGGEPTLRIPGDRHLAYYFPEAGKYLGFRVCTPLPLAETLGI